MKPRMLPAAPLLALVSLYSPFALATDFCTRTADALHRSCQREAGADRHLVDAICINISDAEERKECFEESAATRDEEGALCGNQRSARVAVCNKLGEDRYDPGFDPSLFDADFNNLTQPNRYFPLKIGNKWEYAGGGETVKIEVLNRTKLIEGVTCIVVRDQGFEDGDLIEDTDDWFAQARNGDVYYCGEDVKDFESFEGDKPELPELVSIDGSFKAGRDGDKPGILFLGKPEVGAFYRQEFSPGNAEDLAEVLSTTYSFGSNQELDEFVPQALAQLLCNNNCVVTKEINPSEPGVFERKYYALGIGQFLSVNPEQEEAVQLANCNFDARCMQLPKPPAPPED